MLRDPMPARHAVAFYLGIPVLMSAMYALNHAGLGRHLTIVQGMPYWLGIWVPFWLLLDLATRTSALVLRPWSSPLWLILLIGSALAIFASKPYVVWYLGLYADWLPADSSQQVPTIMDAWHQLDRLLGFMGAPFFWVAVNYYYDRILGIPRYHGRLVELHADPSAAQPTIAAEAAAPAPLSPEEQAQPSDMPLPSQPVASTAATEGWVSAQAADGAYSATLAAASNLLDLLPAKVGRDVVALQAEDHYVRVHTELGSALVRYRFSDAMRDLEVMHGLQVHRSFWVRASAVTGTERDEGRWTLVLKGGQHVPVSQAYRAAVRAARLPT